MKSNSFKNEKLKKAALSITLTQLLLSSSLALANEKKPEEKGSISEVASFELIECGPQLAGGDTNFVCGNNYGCV